MRLQRTFPYKAYGEFIAQTSISLKFVPKPQKRRFKKETKPQVPMKSFRLSILLVFCAWAACAQNTKISDDPTQFVADVQKMMALDRVPNYLKAAKNLETVWLDTRFTPAHQQKTVAITRRLLAKGNVRGNAVYEQFFNAVYAALNGAFAAPDQLEGFLNTTAQVIENYDPKNMLKFLETGRIFFESRLIYKANFNRLYALDGTFNFRYSEVNSEKTIEAAKVNAANDGWGNAVADSSGASGPIFYQKKAIPNVSGAIIEFKDVSLIMTTASDSVVVREANGKLAIREGTWVGAGGKFSWEVAGAPDIFVILTNYSFNVANPKLQADDVRLSYAAKLNKSVEGAFEYESKRRNKGQPSPYPRFISYRNDASLRGLSKNVQYAGGLSLVGLKTSSASLSETPSIITVLQNDKVAFKASSRRFEWSDSLITAPLATFSASIGPTDSLYHPGVRLSYNDRDGVLKCERADRTGFQGKPYADSYHKMYIEAQMLRWVFSKNQLEFLVVAGKTEVPIVFESFNYFKTERFRAISDELSFHPLLMVANYIANQKTPFFSPEDLAVFYKKDANVMRGACNQMLLEDYFEAEPSNGLLKLSRKGALYVLANNKQTDFDNLRIISLYQANAQMANASIDFNSKELIIRGVNQFVISDSLKIFAYPSDKQVRVLKNRDFWMNGLLKSANFRFNGRDLQFNYEKFFVDLNKIDNITYVPKNMYEKGGSTEVGGDVVYEKSGRIYLNDPKNKSGKNKNSVFPRLSVPEGMTVYFDQPDRGNLAYNRKVFFKIPTIDYDSLGTQDIMFIGTFESGGIMPPFQAQLRSMEDNSLGFKYISPAAGFKLYGTNTTVKFNKELVMDKQGLRSQGEISHFSARIPTQSMLFMTDSLMASGAEAQIKEATIGKTYFPNVELRNYTMCWVPKADSMSLTTKGNDFNFYMGSTKLEGRLLLRSTGLYGKGFLKRDDSELTSQDIKFNKEGFLAGDAQYKIVSAQNNIRPVLLGRNVDVDFNIVKGLVNIATNNQTLEEASSFEFPSAAYRTSINRAQWNINAKTIAMKGNVNTSTFMATAPEQEGLVFNGSAALYEIEKASLNISGVPFIKTADAKVLPDKGLVTIKRNGEMLPFQKARLVLDTLNEYHRLKNGNIQIVSKNKFTGDATYLYTTVSNDTIPVKMGNFELREMAAATTLPTSSRNNKTAKPVRGSTTVARAEIGESQNFMVASRLQYKGAMTMLAAEPNLQFNGFVRTLLKKRPNLEVSWVLFKENPTKDIAINITPSLKNEVEQPISVGLHYRTGADGLYPTFLSAKESKNDQTIFTAQGQMRFDDKTKSFKIMPEAKTANELTDEENAYTFNDAKGTFNFMGRLNLLNDRAKEGEELFLSAGSVQANVDSSTYKFNTLLSLNFPANRELVAKVAQNMVQSNLDEQNSDPAEPEWARLSSKLSALVGRKAAESYVNRAAANYRPLHEASPKMNTTLVLSNVNLRWSAAQNAFYSVGKIGVSNLNTTDINAQMDGMLEIRKSPRGDEISIYLAASDDLWYYFDWQQGKLAVVVSVQEINDLLMVKSKGEKSKESGIIPIGFEERDLFVDRFTTLYRPKPPKKAPPVVAGKNAKTPANKNATTAPTPAGKKPAVAAAPEPEEEAIEDTKTTAKTTDPKSKTTDPKAKTTGKVVQTPAAKPPVKKPSKKEEEKEGF